MRKVFKRIWRTWQIRVICGTQNRLRIRGKYLNVLGECAERIYVYMEKTQRESWRILLIRKKDIKVCISRLIIIQILKHFWILFI